MGDTQNPDAQGQSADTATTTTEKAAEPLLPQSKVNALLAAERRAAAEKLRGLDELTAKVSQLEEEKRAAEEAKLSQAERLQRELERERAKAAKALADLEQRFTTERTRRHDTTRRHEAARLVAGVVPKLHTPALAEVLTREIAERLVVREDEQGERVELRLGTAAGDTEPVESGWPKLLEALSPTYFRAQPGSGAQHGTGAGGGARAWASLSPSERIAAGLNGRR